MSCETPFPYIPNGFRCKVSLFRSAYPNTDGVCLYAEESELERFVLATVVGRKQSESSFFYSLECCAP